MEKRLGKSVVQVICANILNLFISIGNGFLLPKYLSVEAYADLKIFLMYISYIGAFHFGYIDGIYIKYGGKNLSEINGRELESEKKTLALLQLVVSIPIILIAFLVKDIKLLFAAICILPSNLVAFYKLVYQATGSFKKYRYITNLSSFLVFLCNLLLLFLVKTDKTIWYIGIQAIVFYIVWLYYEHKNRVVGVKLSNKEILERIWSNINLGIIIMLGNSMSIWITNLDRWFVKVFCNVSEFAYYSFAVTMLKMINIIITAFSVTLYNFFCVDFSKKTIYNIRELVLVVGAILIAVFFPLHFVIQIYLNEYINTIPVIQILFAVQFILIEINAIYVNLFKALNLQKKYMRQMIIILIIAFLLNVVIGYLWNSNIKAYAVATLLTSLIWLGLNQKELSEFKMRYREWIFISLTIVVFFACDYVSVWIGLGIYFCWIFIGTFLLFPEVIHFLREMLFGAKGKNI